MDTQSYKCPLCGSILNRDHWIKITGLWSEQEKQRLDQKKLNDKYKQEIEAQDKKYKEELLKATKSASINAFQKGVLKEKGERERMTKLIIKQAKDQEFAQKKIQELQKQLKEGKTPQIAGFDYEKEVDNLLTQTFAEDNIIPTGKKGDVIQEVKTGGIIIGKILIECKKTGEYKNEFIKEVKRHQETAIADYAVMVTHAQKKGKSNFFTEEGVIVIDPLGLLDIISFLRQYLLEAHNMKLTKEEAKEKGIQILRYMQTGEFKKNMIDTIEKSRKAYQLLTKEVEDHKKTWIERIGIYQSIHNNSQAVRQAIGEIVTGKHIQLEKYEFPQFEETSKIKLISSRS